MPATRHPKRPRLTAAPRYEIGESKYTTIDAALKAARQCAQQVAPLEACLQDEARVLERMYYKGVNQHRAAVFWKRVQESRRLGRRVLEVRFLALLEDLRCSFYVGEGSERNPKILRGVWSQVPDVKSLNFFYGRLVGLSVLLDAAEERLSKAFHSLALMMQTGAFLQTILVLTSIIARLRTIMEELGSVLRSFLHTYESLLQTLGHRRIMIKESETTRLPALDVRKLQGPRKDQRPPATEETFGFGEDLGATVVRETPLESAVDSGAFPRSVTPFWKEENRATHMSIAIDAEVSPPRAESPSTIITHAPTPGGKSVSETGISAQVGSSTIGAKEVIRKVKKKKKRKDEIDEIFGSL